MTSPQAVLWQLPSELIGALQALAAEEECSVEVTVERVLQRGLQELGAAPYGRCSLRTGLCSEGPQPLPLQQP